ncbi:MAG: hypothetical protein HYZ23_04015 [Chloroflexi bacterium]|nr:hypothetical protein [Chloroflexota bacterium]
MNDFNFGEVLNRAWQIIWKHKILWIFGILASCARGNGGSGGNGGTNYQTTGSDNPSIPGDSVVQGFQQVGQYIEDNPWVIFAFIFANRLLFIAFYAAGMMGRIGLIKGVYKSENGAQELSFGEIWSESLPYFWRVFGMNFLLGLVVALLVIPPVIIGLVTAGLGFLCFLPILCILIPLSWILTIVTEQAQPAIVLEDLGIMDGLKRGWEIVKANVVAMIVMSLILGIGSAIVGVVIALPIILAVIPLVIGMGSLRESLTPMYIALACCALYMPVLILFNGIITAYVQSAWALTFMRLSKPKENAPVFVEANA